MAIVTLRERPKPAIRHFSELSMVALACAVVTPEAGDLTA